MAEWREAAISELALGGKAGVAGGPFGSALGRKHYAAQGVPVIRGAQLSGSGRFSMDDLVFVPPEKADRHSGNLAYPGDVIVTQRGTLGQVGLIPRGQPFDRFLLSQSQMKIAVEPKVADAEFVYFALCAPEANQRLVAHATTSGVPHVNLTTLREFQLSVPDVDTQRRIASLLSTFDDLIEINERRIELLEDLARSLYREWFVYFRFPGREGIERVDSTNESLPAGWRVCKLDDIADINRGKVGIADIPDPFQYLDISSVGVGKLRVPSVMSAAEAPGRARRRAYNGDIVWATVRPNRRAHALIHDPPPNLVVSTGLAVLSPVAAPSSFLFEYAASDEFSSHLVERASGSAYPAVRPDDFKCAPVVLPPQSLLRRFDEMADPVLRFASDLQRQNWQFAATRDLLLPRLVTGQLDISDIDLGVLTPAETE